MVATGSLAQDVGGPIRTAIQTLKDKELLPKPNQITPTQPQVNDPTIRSGQLPERMIDPNRQEFKIEKGDMKRNGPVVVLTGPEGTHLIYAGYEIFADRIEGNLDTKVFKASGNVKVFGEKAFVKGGEVTVNMRNETFLAKDA
ncbi:MAG: hypothetical protein H7Y17_05195 [Chlorobia bacterium]|nr:hypothetical protein [Fimbriimonadaceae bacterium]